MELNNYCSGGVLRLHEGSIESNQKECKDNISTIERWTDAFIIFCSIYLSAHPSKMQELLQYMCNIRDCEATVGGKAWLQYDKQFRAKQSKNLVSWAKMNSDLWIRFTNRESRNALQNLSAFSDNKPNATVSLPCRDFNNGTCRWPSCKYRHVCMCCGYNHSELNCRRRSQANYSTSGVAQYNNTGNTNTRSTGPPFHNSSRGAFRSSFRGGYGKGAGK